MSSETYLIYLIFPSRNAIVALNPIQAHGGALVASLKSVQRVREKISLKMGFILYMHYRVCYLSAERLECARRGLSPFRCLITANMNHSSGMYYRRSKMRSNLLLPTECTIQRHSSSK